MRNILILCGLILLAGVIWLVTYLMAPEHFGDPFSGAPHADVAALLEHPADFLGKSVTIEGRVARQCAATGCFFYFDTGNKSLKVELGEVAAKLPARAGKRAVVEGQLVPFGDGYQFLGRAVEFE